MTRIRLSDECYRRSLASTRRTQLQFFKARANTFFFLAVLNFSDTHSILVGNEAVQKQSPIGHIAEGEKNALDNNKRDGDGPVLFCLKYGDSQVHPEIVIRKVKFRYSIDDCGDIDVLVNAFGQISMHTCYFYFSPDRNYGRKSRVYRIGVGVNPTFQLIKTQSVLRGAERPCCTIQDTLDGADDDSSNLNNGKVHLVRRIGQIRLSRR
jgi:hypothetical protein